MHDAVERGATIAPAISHQVRSARPTSSLLREDIILTEAKVERIVPALDQTISAVAILGATPESATQLASAVNVAELARITPGKAWTTSSACSVINPSPSCERCARRARC